VNPHPPSTDPLGPARPSLIQFRQHTGKRIQNRNRRSTH
jgi:hypothetical protein